MVVGKLVGKVAYLRPRQQREEGLPLHHSSGSWCGGPVRLEEAEVL